MLYIGVTSDLIGRVFAHKNDLADGFTNKYHIHNLVHFEITEDINSAISREKQLKKWNRAWKTALTSLSSFNLHAHISGNKLRRPVV